MANPARVNLIMSSARMTGARLLALFLCLCVTIIDGLDFVAIGVVAPLMMDDIALTQGEFGVVMAMTQIGALIGAISLGKAADRYGRKPLIITSLLLIAFFTVLTPFARTFETMLPVRFLVGLALTGALPATLAMASELASGKYKATIIAIVVAGFPMGAAMGSVAGGQLAAASQWENIFYLGAALAALLSIAVYYLMPESPSFLASHDNRDRKLRDTLARLVRGADTKDLWRPLSKRDMLPDDRNVSRVPASIGALFEGDRARQTWLLWGMLLCSGVLSNVALVWIPTIFADAGIGVASSSIIVAAINGGATLGMASAGRILDGIGPRLTIGVAFLVGAVTTFLLGQAPTIPLIALTGGIMGFFLGITTSAGYALSALIYPVSIRSTGVGGGAAALRFGTIVAPLTVPLLLAIALPMSVTFAIVAVVPLVAALIASRFGRGASPKTIAPVAATA